METSMSVPLDEGFLRRECPSCERQFKWFHGDVEGKPEGADDADVYFCPYCGTTAAVDEWWTPTQLQAAIGELTGPVMQYVEDELKDAFKSLNRSGFVRAELTTTPAPPPPALTEPHDMAIVEPPCHPWEPVKVLEDWGEPIHCIVCGAQFTV